MKTKTRNLVFKEPLEPYRAMIEEHVARVNEEAQRQREELFENIWTKKERPAFYDNNDFDQLERDAKMFKRMPKRLFKETPYLYTPPKPGFFLKNDKSMLTSEKVENGYTKFTCPVEYVFPPYDFAAHSLSAGQALNKNWYPNIVQKSNEKTGHMEIGALADAKHAEIQWADSNLGFSTAGVIFGEVKEYKTISAAKMFSVKVRGVLNAGIQGWPTGKNDFVTAYIKATLQLSYVGNYESTYKNLYANSATYPKFFFDQITDQEFFLEQKIKVNGPGVLSITFGGEAIVHATQGNSINYAVIDAEGFKDPKPLGDNGEYYLTDGSIWFSGLSITVCDS